MRFACSSEGSGVLLCVRFPSKLPRVQLLTAICRCFRSALGAAGLSLQSECCSVFVLAVGSDIPMFGLRGPQLCLHKRLTGEAELVRRM